MDCRTANDQVSAWLDGKLASGEVAFLRHLSGCRACARETEELQTVLAAFRTTGVAVPAPEGFAGRVMTRLQAEPLTGGKQPLFRKLALAASFLFLLGMNSLLVGRFLGGSSRVQLPPVSAPASDLTTEPAAPEPVPADPIEAPVPGGQEAPPAKPELIAPAVNAPKATAVPSPAKPVRRPAKAQPLPQPQPVRPVQQQEPEQQLRVATLPPAIIPDPEVFVQQRRVTEGVLLKVAVKELSLASQRLADAAGVQDLVPVMASEALAEDGRLIKVYRYEVPYLQSNRFVTEALKLGRVLDERYVAEDVSNEYGRKLEQYSQLAARAQEAGGAEAEELHRSINALLLELAGMHSAARDMKAVTIWLES